MNQKKQKASGRATDITAPKKPTEAGTAPLVIPKRSIIGQETAEAEATEKASSETPIVTMPMERKTIRPVTVTDGSEADPPADKPAPAETEQDPPKDEKDAKAPDAPDEPEADTPAPAPAEEPAAAPESESAPESEDDGTDDDDDASKTPKTKEELQAEQTAKAVKRERELQEYIKNQKYFVPVNTVEKKSIRVSFGLVALLFLLGLILIDLLLDTGAILLIQKIPHTHFFNLYH